MYEIVNRDKKLADKLIHTYSDMMFSGVVAGNNAGKVWVDDLDNPDSAIVWSDGLQCFQFMGCFANQKFNDELNSFINGAIISFLKERDLNYFEYSSDVEEWYPIIRNALADRDIKEDWQYVYRSKLRPRKETEEKLTEPYCFYWLDEDIVSSVRKGKMVSNPEFLINYIEQFWGSADNYLKKGCGVLAITDDKAVSFVLTSFLFRDTFSIGVETLEQHRKKGLAGALTKILLKKLCDEGYKIWWDCMKSNIPSQKTAESADLVRNHEYKVCWFNF
jgi:RimJ/RimL family protein N-acetyltransferase